MADFNMHTTLSSLNTVHGFVRENLVHPHQKSHKTEAKKDSTELEERQEITAKEPLASRQSSADIATDMNREELDETIIQLNDSLQNVQRNLKFSVDKDAGRIVINVTDKETDELVRQIPSEEVLELARNLQEMNLNLSEPIGERSESHSRSRTEGVFLRTSV